MATALQLPGRQGLRADAFGQVCICGSALASALIAATVLVGWALDSPALKAVLPGAVQMKPNTALALLLAAAALWMLRSLGSSAPHRTFRIAQGLGLIVALIGLLTLGEYLFGLRLHIDQLLFVDRAVAFNKIPGRMSPYSAFAFVAIGSMMTAFPHRQLRAAVLLGIILTVMIGVLASLGYVWRASELTTDQWLPPVAVNTGVGFILLAAGALALTRGAGRHTPVDLRAAPRMQAKVLLGFGVTMALLILGGGITYRMQARFDASVQVFTHAEQLRSALGDVYASMAAAELAARQPAQSFRPRAAALGDDRTVLQRLAALRSTLAPADRQLIDIDEIEHIVNGRLAELHGGGVLTPQRAALAGPGALDALRTQIEQFDRTEADLRNVRTLEVSRDRSFTLISLLLTLGFAGATLLTLYASIVRDVRERASIISALEAAKGEAQWATQAKSEFLAAMSHEIRTPMNAVLGLTEVLQQSSLTGRQLELVTLIRESGDGLLAIIDDILDFSKIEAGRLALERLPMCVADVVENTCGLLNRLAERKGVSLSMHVDPAIPATLLGDPTRLRQILINLIGNAIKFSAGLARPGHVDVRAQLSGGDPEQAVVQFSVADNGIGIEASTLTRLFQSFTQADSSTTRLYGGTGLGLTISKRLAVLAGGDISVTTAVNEGSTFMLRLPFHRAPGEATPERPLGGLHCLLLPRSTGLLKDLASYLIAAGANVEYTGQEGKQEGSDPAVSKPAIWVAEASPEARDSTVSLLALRGMQRPRAMVLVVTGRRPDRRPEAEAEGVVVIDGNALSRHALIDAVLRAAGRAPKPLAAEATGLRPRARSLAPLTREEARRRRRLILVAEDNPVNQQVIRQQLDLLGHTADIAATGRQALERWRSGDYALVLADLHMPELDGYGLTLAIRLQEAGQARTPIIALTANALHSEAERCLAAGMDGYLTKPASLQQLGDELQRWLPQDCPDTAAIPLPASPPPPPLVPGALEALVGHDPQLLAGLLSQFLDSAEHQTQAIVAAASADRWSEVAQHAHSLKSSARAVGADALGELCAGLERACLSGAAGGLAEQLAQLQAEMATVAAHLRSTPSEYQADPVPLGRAAEA